MNQKTGSSYSCPSDRSPTISPIRDHDGGTSSEANTESVLSENSSSPSPENDAWLTVAYAKHRMMVSLMRDVYIIFNSPWEADFRSQTGSQAASTGASSQSSSSQMASSTGKGKRKMRNGDFQPPEANEEKKRKIEASKNRDGGPKRLFACFFNKFNAQKYCSNGDTGSRYRSCAGPGFSKISQLK